MSSCAVFADTGWSVIDDDPSSIDDFAVVMAAMQVLAEMPATTEDQEALSRQQAAFSENLKALGLTEAEVAQCSRARAGTQKRGLRIVGEGE